MRSFRPTRRTFLKTGTAAAALIGIGALLLSAMAAAAFAALPILVINPQSFGWSIRTEIPWGNLAAAFVLALAATIAASAGPARLAAAANPAAGIREE